jgi:excisionase family DNA binding protein
MSSVTTVSRPAVGDDGERTRFFSARSHLSPAEPEADILVASEVAQLLRINLKTVYELAKAGELPCWRLGRHFRFSRRAIVSRLAQCKPASHRKGQ